jgi:hypothetical protein
MSLLFRVIFAAKARSTHHKLALDALRHLRGALSDQWVDAFLYYADAYLTGSKAPDDKFKDFKNHVIHVSENYWGGAVESAKNWYDRTVAGLRDRRWNEAAYSAGVLSHYFTDPFMPLHTAQSESEGSVHRALEWSVTKSYEELQNLLIDDLGGYPDIQPPEGDDWLGAMIRAGARAAHASYDALIDHYNVPVGVKDPPRGLDQECRDRLAPLIGAATVGFARVLERAIDEADVSPPLRSVSVPGFLESLDLPFQWIANRIHDSRERAAVEAIYEEFANTGKVIHALSEDDRAVRRMHAEEVLKISLVELDRMPARAPGTKHGTGAAPRAICNWPVTSREAATTAYAGPRKRRERPRRSEVPKPAVMPVLAPVMTPALALTAATVPSSTKPAPSEKAVTQQTPPPPAFPTLKFAGAKDERKREPTRPVQEILREVKGAGEPRLAVPKPRTALAPAPKAPEPAPAEPAVSSGAEQTDAPTAAPTEATGSATPTKRGWKNWLSIFKRTTKLDGKSPSSEPAPENENAPAEPAPHDGVEFVPSGTQSIADSNDESSAAETPFAPARSSTLKFRLNSEAPVVDAPSIGQKTARRLEAIGITTVAEFLAMDVEDGSQKMGLKHLDPKTLREWQAQTRLALRIPNLRGHDAQILVGCGYKEPEQVARAKADDLLAKVDTFCATSEGERVLRSGPKPDASEIASWIAWAGDARPLKAA